MMDNKETFVFTPAALLEVLSNIEELKNYAVGITETIDGKLQLQVGNSVYELEQQSPQTDIDVDEYIVDKVEDINEDAYNSIPEYEDTSEPVEGGIISELAKNMLLGGMIRLSGKLLK